MSNELMRRCTKCGKERKLSEFHAKQSKCKACFAAEKKAKRNDPEQGEKIREKDREYKKRHNATPEGKRANRANVKSWRDKKRGQK